MSVGSDETIAPFRRKLPEKLVFIFVFAFTLALNIPVCEPGVIAQFARWSLVRALTEHDPETIARQEAPARGRYRILLESKNVHVVTSRCIKITDRQHASVLSPSG